MTYTTTATQATHYASRTQGRAPVNITTPVKPSRENSVSIKVATAAEPAFTTQTATSSFRSTTTTSTSTTFTYSTTTRSTIGDATTNPSTTNTTSSALPREPEIQQFYEIFYRKINELTDIVDQYPLYNLQGERLREDRVSPSLSEWSLSALEHYNQNPTLSGEALHKDVIERLQKLASILVDDVQSTLLKTPLLDRNKYVWDQTTLDDWVRLSRLAVTSTLKINQFRIVERTVKGVTRQVEVLLSPIDEKPIAISPHAYAKAYIDWYYSLPWDLISPSAVVRGNPSTEAGFKEGSERSLAVNSSDMTSDQMMKFLAIKGCGPSVRSKLSSLERAEKARKATENWKKDAAELEKGKKELVEATRKKIKDLKKTMHAAMHEVRASCQAAEASFRAREANLRGYLEEDAKRISALEADNKNKDIRLNQANGALSAANANAAAANARANAVEERVVTVERVVHKNSCVLQ